MQHCIGVLWKVHAVCCAFRPVDVTTCHDDVPVALVDQCASCIQTDPRGRASDHGDLRLFRAHTKMRHTMPAHYRRTLHPHGQRMVTAVTVSSCEAPVMFGTQRERCSSCSARANNMSFLVQRNRNEKSLHFLGLDFLRCKAADHVTG